MARRPSVPPASAQAMHNNPRGGPASPRPPRVRVQSPGSVGRGRSPAHAAASVGGATSVRTDGGRSSMPSRPPASARAGGVQPRPRDSSDGSGHIGSSPAADVENPQLKRAKTQGKCTVCYRGELDGCPMSRECPLLCLDDYGVSEQCVSWMEKDQIGTTYHSNNQFKVMYDACKLQRLQDAPSRPAVLGSCSKKAPIGRYRLTLMS
jgi:hypothetical protein